MNIKKRIKLYKYYRKLLETTQNKQELFVKGKVIGEGHQGKVYKYCTKDQCMDNEIAIKKIYLNVKESKYVDNIYDSKALKHGPFIELAANQLVNQLILQEISPHFILMYDYDFEERWGVCADIYPYKSYFYNEFMDDTETYTDWVSNEHSDEEWYNAFFQITTGIYTLQKYFNMTHLDLHSDNILVKKIKKGGFWSYVIDGETYHLPNLGYQFYIFDFGHAWIPNAFKSWFISQKYKKKQIHKGFDIFKLFQSTLYFDTAPKKFKKDVNHLIRKLRKNEPFENTIQELWKDKYPTRTSHKIINIFNMNKKLVSTLPKELQHLNIY